MMAHRTLIALTCLLAVAATCRAHAADGVIEINQACALNGCYAGDAPGFPVFITEPGSYRLTGNLDLTATPDTTGIQISASFVTLDLNGFEIVGPKVCTGSGPTLNCGGTDDGAGVLVEPDARAAVIRNGTVRNMGVEGIWGRSDGLTIDSVRAIHNARNGLRGETNSLVINSIAIENGDDGFEFGARTVARSNSSFGNGNRGFRLGSHSKFATNVSGENAGTNTCGGGICSEQRRYYLTPTTHAGNDVVTVCTDGFHLASLWEIWNPSELAYDTILGHTEDNSGQGAPVELGWAREGLTSGGSNCNGWSSGKSGTGMAINLSFGTALEDPGLQSSPWIDHTWACDDSIGVWCVED